MYEEINNRYIKHLDFVLIDILMTQIALIVSYKIRYNTFYPYGYEVYLRVGILCMIVNLLMVFWEKSYKDIVRRGYGREFTVSLIYMIYFIAVVLAGLFLSGIQNSMSRLLILIFFSIGTIMIYIGRTVFKYLIRRMVVSRKVKRYVAVLTTKDEADTIIDKIKNDIYSEYELNKVFLISDEGNTRLNEDDFLSNYSEELLQDYLKKEVIDEVFINLPPKIKLPVEVLNICYQMGITVHMMLIRREYEMGGKALETFVGYPVLTSGMKIAKPHQIFIKRSTDVVLGMIGILITALITIILAPIIYIKDPGPIFFSQTRIGKNGRKFKIYKFRSMYMDAEGRKEELMAQNEMQGLMFKITNDPRILPGIGNKIRDWSLDEFPQFWNVLKGDMSLVGTRPPTLDEWEKYEYRHCRRLAVKPGLTGMWQVSGRSDFTNFEEIVELDTRYITNWTIGLDFKILLKTILVVFTKSGSR